MRIRPQTSFVKGAFACQVQGMMHPFKKGWRMNKARIGVFWILLLSSIQGTGVAQEPKGLTEPKAKLQFWLKARQILISHKDADQSRHSRSRENAKTRAKRIHRLLSTSTDSKEFSELARKVSDAPDKESGGALPPLRSQNFEESAAKAILALKVGAFSAPVETRFGFHIFLKESSEEYGLEQRLFRYKGAERCPESETQSEGEAQAAADKLLLTLKKDGDFKGEVLGLVAPSMIAKEVARVLVKLKPGELHRGVIRSKFGFHVIRRIPIELACGAHILIDHELGFQSVSLRTKDDAKKTAEQVLAELKKDPTRFLELHEKHSADKRPSLGVIPKRGPQALSAIQEAIFQVKKGAVVGRVLESRYGFHIVLRTG